MQYHFLIYNPMSSVLLLCVFLIIATANAANFRGLQAIDFASLTPRQIRKVAQALGFGDAVAQIPNRDLPQLLTTMNVPQLFAQLPADQKQIVMQSLAAERTGGRAGGEGRQAAKNGGRVAKTGGQAPKNGGRAAKNGAGAANEGNKPAGNANKRAGPKVDASQKPNVAAPKSDASVHENCH